MSTAIMHAEGVKKSFSGHAVLNGLDWQIKQGQVIGLLGRNGAGKSTLIECLLGLRELDAGKVSIYGEDACDLSEATRARIGYVPQKSDLFEWLTPDQMLAYFKVLYPRWNEAKVEGLLERWGFTPLMRNKAIGKLSGGERQRLSIARALLKNPPILILDEATSALDAVTEAKVNAALDEVMKGRTTFVIAHRLSTIRNATSILVFDHGRVIESGTFDELVAKGGHFADLAKAQFMVQEEAAGAAVPSAAEDR